MKPLAALALFAVACSPEASNSPPGPGDPSSPTLIYRFTTQGRPGQIAIAAEDRSIHSTRLALDKMGARLYVLDEEGQQVQIVDLRARRLAGQADVGARPASLSLTADGQRLMVARADGVLQVLDTAAGRNLGQVGVGASASAVAVTPGGRFAYVADPADTGVGIVDTGAGPTPWDTVLAVTDRDGLAVRFFDGDGRPLYAAALGVRPDGLAWSADRTRAVVAFNLGGAPGLAVVDLPLGTTRLLALPAPADSLPLRASAAVDLDGEMAYVVAGRALYLVDTAAAAPAQPRVVGLGAQALAVAAGAGVAYVLTDDFSIHIIGTDPERSVSLR